MRTCPNCGNKVSDTAKFCVECGTKLEEKKEIYCPNCNSLFTGGKFCMECGYNMQDFLNKKKVEKKNDDLILNSLDFDPFGKSNEFDPFHTNDDFDFNMEYFDENGNANIGITQEQIPQFEIGINHNGFRGELLGEEKNNIVRDNIFPEGYFYKPHYRVKLKEYSNILTHGYDTVLVDNPIYDLSKIVGHNIKISETGVFKKYALELNKEYSFTNEDKIVMFYEDGHKEEYYVYHSDEPKKICFYDFNKTLDEIKDGLVRVFYKNNDIPEYAYYTGDGTGKYVWRELIKDTELSQESDIYDRMYANGAVYINTNINFYLRRQDPYGIYGLQYMNGDDSEMGGVGMASSFKIKGVETEIFDADYITEENNSVCEI